MSGKKAALKWANIYQGRYVAADYVIDRQYSSGHREMLWVLRDGGHKVGNYATLKQAKEVAESMHALRKNQIKHPTLERALKLRAKFRATAGTAKDKKPRVKTVSVPKTAAVQIGIGKVLAIEYQLVDEHGKHIKGQAFRHEFTGKSQPMLTTDSAGKQLYFVGGSYRFKTDGINDTKQ